MKMVLVLFLLVSLALSSCFFEVSIAGSDFCDSKCAVRCSKAGVQDRCLKYCGICCEKCHCVPSGTFGHKDECPCYRDMKNSKGKSKCP
ncbi:Snakin-1 [Gossypium arboreum]|uniref:Snakin-1 n=9 Tax=Gossypium TaxID=3633 RepID=A0A0B0MB03_GOSAR|nr:peamaclein [Gossypium raimondii]XP_017644991.1 peamaclein [Gossypium arboreum]XP_040970774.1 peamaclein [Gossypium hirsutum]KAB2023503.1 hypothetical protein ES319_D06G023900v1 [Gossypium barbadense]MBA0810019.1 hypothetical protein [Gossypium harknessii]TYG63385.1 hypothetical protein ES288_D06G025700v1 [Gossypium darwinii]TYH65021.1 hypothetical protein ES332_D06G027500v1 [Gossypium tomentosum]TYI75707.1 hypothetical protein E1A91_D06G025600v1 [Gossypium mustelinum]